MVQLENIMVELVRSRPTVHSDADFQHALAWQLHTRFTSDGRSMALVPEEPVPDRERPEGAPSLLRYAASIRLFGKIIRLWANAGDNSNSRSSSMVQP